MRPQRSLLADEIRRPRSFGRSRDRRRADPRDHCHHGAGRWPRGPRIRQGPCGLPADQGELCRAGRRRDADARHDRWHADRARSAFGLSRRQRPAAARDDDRRKLLGSRPVGRGRRRRGEGYFALPRQPRRQDGHQGGRLHHPSRWPPDRGPDARRIGGADARTRRHRDRTDDLPPGPRRTLRCERDARRDRARTGHLGTARRQCRPHHDQRVLARCRQRCLRRVGRPQEPGHRPPQRAGARLALEPRRLARRGGGIVRPVPHRRPYRVAARPRAGREYRL